MISYLIAFVMGAAAGVITMAICSALKCSDCEHERIIYGQNNNRRKDTAGTGDKDRAGHQTSRESKELLRVSNQGRNSEASKCVN